MFRCSSIPRAAVRRLDPQLTRRTASRRKRSEGSGTLEVLAKLRDPAAAVHGLAVSRVIGDIVTGTVAAADVRRVRADANVISLKAARAVSSRLHRSLAAAAASSADFRAAL